MRTDRLLALSDGVFAIALTLLVLELPVPEDSHDLAGDLLKRWPSFVAYIVSFVTLGIVWINHHALMDRVERADRGLLELNLLLLLLVAVVPWPTGLIASYLRDDEQAGAAAVVYGVTMLLLSLSFAGIRGYVQWRDDLTHPDIRPGLGKAVRRSLVGPVAYAVGTVLATASPSGAFGVFAAIAVYFAVTGRGPAPSMVAQGSRSADGGASPN
jgi:uncharacterized membrane protein